VCVCVLACACVRACVRVCVRARACVCLCVCVCACVCRMTLMRTGLASGRAWDMSECEWEWLSQSFVPLLDWILPSGDITARLEALHRMLDVSTRAGSACVPLLFTLLVLVLIFLLLQICTSHAPRLHPETSKDKDLLNYINNLTFLTFEFSNLTYLFTGESS